MRWEFTPDEFLYAWRQLGADRNPVPLSLRSSVVWRDAWEEIERDLRQRLPVLDDPDLVPVLRTAADPDMSLILIGKRKQPLRAYGAVTANVGVTMVQRSGLQPDVGGNVVVEVGSPTLVPTVFAALSGDRRAGRVARMVESWDRLRHNGHAAGLVGDEATVADRMRNLLAAPRVGDGHIEFRGDRRAGQPPPSRYLSWFDVDGDGRYIYTRCYGDFHIDPCGTDDFRREIIRLMGSVRVQN
ncbi:ESX secretion-associated protein EspG [Nocardia abscessus]|uniref:ESX secretion-associated protein EspG n=1 Tax=Nocardia abscessus TaxID=120957 RepID=UPI0024572FE9|nr:ESX secretion-associated protein EspG [Nocardia abscessus]